MKAVKAGQEIRRRELHEQELGVANLSALTANINRDSKKNKTPYKATDFCFFAEAEDRNEPDAVNSAAYMQLLESKQLPAWALFCYAEMKSAAKGAAAPEPVAAIGDGFILLAPEPANGGLEGLLIAQGKVSGQLVFVKIGRTSCKVQVPEFEDSVIAREHMFIPVY